MNRRIFTIILLLLVTSSVVAQQETWKRYTIRRGEFSVMLPVAPAMATRRVMVMRLAQERQQRTLGAYADGLAFTILCVENSNPRESIEDYLEQEIFTHAGWERTTQQELTLNGFKGKQYIAPNQIPGTMQIFATRNNICRFHAFGAKLDDARIKRFFSSVTLGATNNGIEVKDGNGAYKATTPDNANAFSVKEVDRRPFIAFKPEPGYTEEARQNAIAGSVILRAVLTADGAVTNIKIASGLPYGLEENAIAAAKKIRFIPAMKDGKFVSTTMQLEYNFNLY